MKEHLRKILAARSLRGAEYSLYLFAFASFSIFLAQVGLYLSALLWLTAMLLAKRGNWRRTPLDKPIILFAVVTLFSSFTAASISFHPSGLFKTLGLMLIFYWAYNNLHSKRIIRNALLAFLLGAGLNAFYALASYIYQAARYHDWTRGSGTHSIPQTFSEILIMGCAVLVALCLSYPPLRRRRWPLIPLIIWLLATSISHTRGAWLGLAAALFLIGSLLNFKKTLLITLCLLLALGSIALFWQTIHPEDDSGIYTSRLIHFFDPNWGSNRTRVMIWQAGWEMIKDHPLGIGVDNVYELYPHYRLPDTPEGRFGHLHNNFLQIAAARGWAGLLAFLYLLTRIYLVLFRCRREETDPFYRGLTLGALGAITAFIVSGLTEYTFGDFEVVMIFWFVIALGIGKKTAKRSLLEG